MSLRLFAAVLGAGAICVNSASYADLAAAASANDAGGLQEVVVTAQRREESAQNVGIALSVISGENLAAKDITTVNDLQNSIPSLQVEPAFGSGQPQYRLRGVGFIDYTSNNSSPVGVSVDEVAFAFPIQTEGQLFDIDRVEVLSGPQGTLYGRNTTGGVINFITNRPTADTHAGFTAEYGSHNEVDAEGYVSGTVAENLLGRLSVATEQGGAWQRDRVSGASLGSKDKVAVRGQLEWNPSDIVNFRFGLHWAQEKSDETGLYLLKNYQPSAPGAPAIPADTSRYVTGWSLNPVFANLTGLAGDSKPGLDNLSDGVDLRADIDLGGAKLTSISAFNKLIRREYSDWDATQYYDSDEYLRSDLNVFSEEVRIASTGTGPFGWVGGVYYSKETFDERFYSDLTDRDGGIALTSYGQDSKTLGVFGQGNYQFTDALKGILGVREEHESRDLIDLSTGFISPVLPFTSNLNRSLTSNLPSGKVGLEYKVTDGTLLYASISRGVKSGGFTAHNTLAAAQVDPFQPEKLTAYEIGVKSDLTPTLRLNGAIFHYKYKDQQILTTVFDEFSQSDIGIFTNTDSRIEGGELQLAWRPLAGLNVSQYLGYAEGFYTKPLYSTDQASAPGQSVNFDGRPLSFPKISYGGDLSYDWTTHDYKITVESNYSFHDTYSQFFLLGSSDFTVPKYWLANANLTLSPASGAPWSLTFWGRNIFNKSYDVTRNFFLPTSEVAQAGEPTTVGIRVSYKY